MWYHDSSPTHFRIPRVVGFLFVVYSSVLLGWICVRFCFFIEDALASSDD